MLKLHPSARTKKLGVGYEIEDIILTDSIQSQSKFVRELIGEEPSVTIDETVLVSYVRKNKEEYEGRARKHKDKEYKLYIHIYDEMVSIGYTLKPRANAIGPTFLDLYRYIQNKNLKCNADGVYSLFECSKNKNVVGSWYFEVNDHFHRDKITFYHKPTGSDHYINRGIIEFCGSASKVTSVRLIPFHDDYADYIVGPYKVHIDDPIHPRKGSRAWFEYLGVEGFYLGKMLSYLLKQDAKEKMKDGIDVDIDDEEETTNND